MSRDGEDLPIMGRLIEGCIVNILVVVAFFIILYETACEYFGRLKG